MPQATAIFGFLGAWLLVASPLFQAYLELRDEEIDRSHPSLGSSNRRATSSISELS